MFAKLKMVRQDVLIIYSDLVRRPIFDYKNTFRKGDLLLFLRVERTFKEVRIVLDALNLQPGPPYLATLLT
jgi:hypothetical protein